MITANITITNHQSKIIWKNKMYNKITKLEKKVVKTVFLVLLEYQFTEWITYDNTRNTIFLNKM